MIGKLYKAPGNVARQVNSELLSISDPAKRSFYEKETVNSGWSVRELKRQIESSLFERLLLSRGDANKEQLIAQVEAVLEKWQRSDTDEA